MLLMSTAKSNTSVSTTFIEQQQQPATTATFYCHSRGTVNHTSRAVFCHFNYEHKHAVHCSLALKYKLEIWLWTKSATLASKIEA